MNDQDVEKAYRCTDCGSIRQSRGRLHAHAERHRGLFGIQLPWKVGDAEALEEFTQEVEVVPCV